MSTDTATLATDHVVVDLTDTAGSAVPAATHVVPPVSPGLPPQRRRSTSAFRHTDYLAIGGSAVAAFALAGLLFQLLPWNGPLGFIVVTYVSFLVLFGLVVSFDESGPAVRDRTIAVVVQSLAFLLLLALIFVIAFTLIRGWQALTHSNFFVQDMQDAGPLDPLDVGGIFHAVVGTLWMISIALVITIPLGLSCAVFLNEIPGKFTRFVRTIVEAMTALPSIIAGLFIYATFILILGFPKSGFAAALALSVMMLPIIIRAADVVLRLVPGSLKEASYAMGAGQWRTVWHVTLPTARSGLATAVILGTARGVGETSPVLLTAGFTAALNLNPLTGPMVSLPLETFELVKSPEPNLIARGFGCAAVLMLLVLVLFIIARMIGGRGPGYLSNRQRQKRARQSRRDVARFDARVEAAARESMHLPPAGSASSEPTAYVPLGTPHHPHSATGPTYYPTES
jgi:phosphate transport system permease protein